MPIQAILFDAVGTLIRPEPAVADIYHRVGARYGANIEKADVERRFLEAFRREDERDARELDFHTSEARERDRWRGIVECVFEASDRRGEIFDELWDVFGRAESWRVFDEVPAAISSLREQGYRLGMASNFDRRLRAVVAGHCELASFERCFISSEIGHRKPSPRFFQAVQRELALLAGAILLVGDDRENDVLGARACGWRAVLVDRSAASPGVPLGQLTRAAVERYNGERGVDDEG